MKKFVLLFALCGAAGLHADIDIDYARHPEDRSLESPNSQQDYNTLAEATLSFARAFPNHPVNIYLQSQNNAKIYFEDKILRNLNYAAASGGRSVFMKIGEDSLYYAKNIAHEFIHVYCYDRYGQSSEYGFLTPYDYTLFAMLEEALANTWEQWARVAQSRFEYSRNRSPDLGNHLRYAGNDDKVFDAIEQEIRRENPGLSNADYLTRAGRKFFEVFIRNNFAYLGSAIPKKLQNLYDHHNYLVVPDYEIYRQNSRLILNDLWSTVVELLPFRLEPGKDLEYFKGLMDFGIDNLGRNPRGQDPKNSVVYWVNLDLPSFMLRRLQMYPSQTYDYLPDDYTANLDALLRSYGIAIPARSKPTRPW
jgi:hypothetical protein